MGTNYYHHSGHPCPTCGNEASPRHIGKSSEGWCFALHVYPDDGIRDLEDWRRRWITGRILNEYGDRVSSADMFRIVTRRRGGLLPRRQGDRWYRENHAVPGPNGLVRCSLEVATCVGHGKGTWDLIIGEFS